MKEKGAEIGNKKKETERKDKKETNRQLGEKK